MTQRLIAFSYVGGKFRHLNWLLPLLPPSEIYCEPFGGSAAILLNRQPSKLEIYNDLDGDLVNFFKVLREKPKMLIRQLNYTPYAYEEHELAKHRSESVEPLERARRFYIAIQSSFSVRIDKTWKRSLNRADEIVKFRNHLRNFYTLSRRLRLVQFEHLNAIECLKKYDSPKTLFYIDPPYQLRNDIENIEYKISFGLREQQILAEAIKKLRGKCAISGYTGLYDDLYRDFYKAIGERKLSFSTITNYRVKEREESYRQEILWTNYPIPEGGFYGR